MRSATALLGLLLFMAFVGPGPLLYAQISEEICDNGIDDDGDGRVDLNDPDCACPIAKPISLIANPSFEEQVCCPNFRGQMGCAEGWIQASEATTDYLHTCAWLGWEGLPPPFPFPDGDGIMGFRNGRFNTDADLSNAEWKEYAGACLLSPLRAGVEYKFRFHVGFTDQPHSPPTSISFFGAIDCEFLPFGSGDENYGCPTNGIGWMQLGFVRISGTNTWRTYEINVTPPEDIYAMAIGPDCKPATSTEDLYYFFDNLVLAEQAAFDYEIRPTGEICSDGLTLEFPYSDSLDYQWYLEGVALEGEKADQLSRMYGDGQYQVRLLGPNSCRISAPYLYNPPESIQFQRQVLCEGESLWFDGGYISEAGVYYDTLRAADNCDSILWLQVESYRDEPQQVYAKVFPGEVYEIGPAPHFFYNPGDYTVRLATEAGCDSTILLRLEHYQVFAPNAFSPNSDGINDHFSLAGGDDMEEIESLRIFDRWGRLMYEGLGLSPKSMEAGWDGYSQQGPVPEGVYVYQAGLRFDDQIVRYTSGSVMLFR
ncbi:MAG: gliding motility-associated C-terminal domain-containing protein [Bacteroidota bacterium]